MKLLILDKDNTIAYPTHGQFVDSPWHQARIEGVAAALDRYIMDGWTIAIASNQGGVERGYKTLSGAFLEFRFALELFPQIQEAYFCPDFAGMECWRVWDDCKEDHRIQYKNERVLIAYGADGLIADGYKSIIDPSVNFRKPCPGMLKLAIAIHQPDEVLYVGDRPEDEGAASAAGISFVWAHNFWRQP